MSSKHVSVPLTLERLWQFSLQYYSVKDVKDACLNLQNQFKGNVNLLLLLKWLDEQQAAFLDEDWHKVEECLGRSETLLHSYRDLRRKLKSHVPDTLYRESLQFELQLEKQQQSDLVDCINSIELQTNRAEPLTLRYCRQLGGEHLHDVFAHSIDDLTH
ncbi:TIGR02444 family protein [Vibrio coralliilyticus]|uniref:TIGR02444 family protein n=1 Tax=Vibrio coralliilyticus TaxID=190893 RepID=UPI001560D0C6|nr:TIGR02444 family protein [Vibrio coralliilyticus]NRF31393.1 TIGR02444 family protein [Vibrio coralliilyticus]NRF54861.1 TIGR02444 family protein [Vibrio coralliilyticus]NRG02641.1 TIGR02444 family protein [Vibrio coralliilyticus]